MGIKFYDSNGKYWGEYDETRNLFIPSEETITQTETQNSNSTFENRTMLDCYNCKRYKSDDACVECRYEPKDTPQTELTAKCLNCHNAKACKENHWDGCIYEPQTDLSTEEFVEGMKNLKMEAKQTNNSGTVGCDRYIIVNEDGEKAYGCMGCPNTNCEWQ